MNPDRYDRAVLAELSKADGAVRTKDLNDLYREAGLRNRRKAKQRIKDLEAAGLIKNAGPWRWAYAGDQQEVVA